MKALLNMLKARSTIGSKRERSAWTNVPQHINKKVNDTHLLDASDWHNLSSKIETKNCDNADERSPKISKYDHSCSLLDSRHDFERYNEDLEFLNVSIRITPNIVEHANLRGSHMSGSETKEFLQDTNAKEMLHYGKKIDNNHEEDNYIDAGSKMDIPEFIEFASNENEGSPSDHDVCSQEMQARQAYRIMYLTNQLKSLFDCMSDHHDLLDTLSLIQNENKELKKELEKLKRASNYHLFLHREHQVKVEEKKFELKCQKMKYEKLEQEIMVLKLALAKSSNRNDVSNHNNINRALEKQVIDLKIELANMKSREDWIRFYAR